MYCMTRRSLHSGDAQHDGTARPLKLSLAPTCTLPVLPLLLKLYLLACARFATPGAPAFVSAMRRLIVHSSAASPEGTLRPTCFFLIFRTWADLHLYSNACSAASSVGALLRCLAAPASTCMWAAMTVDVALWASDRVRHGSRHRPRALFAAILKELSMRHTECRRAIS